MAELGAGVDAVADAARALKEITDALEGLVAPAAVVVV